MLKIILTIFLFFICTFFKAQTDSAVINKNTLSNQTISKKNPKPTNSPPALGDIFKPKISLGAGMLSFRGDLYSKHYQAPWTARIGYDLNISQRLTKSIQLNFNILFGKLGANEWVDNRQENFQAEIRSGGISLMYDFGNIIAEDCRIRPWISAGINSFEFLSKTDLYDKNGNKYYYWDDGSIKNIDQSAPTASLAVNLNRDYVYESDIRELNKDGFGKYQERAWAFPIGFGALLKVTDRIDLKLGVQYYFTTTDYIDGISNKSIATRQGTKQKDNFVYTSFALQYDLVFKKKSASDTLPEDYFDSVDFLAIDKEDRDNDDVRDWEDKCHGTPAGVKVDAFGCPLDDDNDGVPNYTDDELVTPANIDVNSKGVALSDEYWQNWYNVYMDSGNVVNQQYVGNFYTAEKDSLAKANFSNELLYTVELARYDGPVPNAEMAYLLSIGDVKSTVLADNTIVLYTAGTYKEIVNAVKRRNEFIEEGSKNAKVGYFKNGDLITLSDDEINKLLEDNKLKEASNTENSNTTDNVKIIANENEFAKSDIVYRVQLGAYKNKISMRIFKNVGNILEFKSVDYFRYATKGFKTIEAAANLKADLVVEGYGDAFITAYKDGKRIPLSATKATMDTKEIEDINKLESFSSVDKSLVSFKIQLGALRKAGASDIEEKVKNLSDVEKQNTSTGMLRYTTGTFSSYSKADKYREELVEKGFAEAFVIALFKGEVISIQEALELLK